MPIDEYGVLLGRLIDWRRETPDNQGRYRHALFRLDVAGVTHTCAVDVDTKDGAVLVHWKILELRPQEWAAQTTGSDGWTPLASNAASGAVDYIRDPRLWDYVRLDYDVFDPFWRFRRRPWWKEALLKAIREPRLDVVAAEARIRRRPEAPKPAAMASTMSAKLVLRHRPWRSGTSEMAFADLATMLEGEASPRMMFFGSFFTTGAGVHDIHQNQGDPPPPPESRRKFYENSGIWQDGLTVVIRADGSMAAFMNKFGTQSDATDANGHPL